MFLEILKGGKKYVILHQQERKSDGNEVLYNWLNLAQLCFGQPC